MQDLNKTMRINRQSAPEKEAGELTVTVFDGMNKPKTYSLDGFGKQRIFFGRDIQNDIPIESNIVSHTHGRFALYNGKWHIEEKSVYSKEKSANGLICNEAMIYSKELSDGDIIRIDDGVEALSEGVLLLFSSSRSESKWNICGNLSKDIITVGRDSGNDIVLPHISVSKHHAEILRESDGFYLVDNNSTNGIVVNNHQISGKYKLHEKDVITITNSKLIFTSSAIYFCCFKNGISVDTENVVIIRKNGRKKNITSNNVSLNIKPGELVAIIGGSGAGKSTILNCMCGYLPPDKGDVYINGINLYDNFDSLKKIIGYVPQSDIVYDNLTLYNMLSYTAKLRLPADTSKIDRENAINNAIALVELVDKKDSLIKSLSGGQRKRASIAVELLSDPNLLFLDEPASGLDPGTERNLMHSLKNMAESGKTVILVTHSTLQLKLCDKIAFMGRGGRLCFFGSYDDALSFFGVTDIVDVYNLITYDSEKWSKKYDSTLNPINRLQRKESKKRYKSGKKRFQLPVLFSRYSKLVINDKIKTVLLFLQAPALAFLISLVADGYQFEQNDTTKSLLFALACCAFWVGILNAIQEICKERNIVKREYMTGLSLNAYILSKIAVLGVMCLIQSVLIVGAFVLLVGIPEQGLIMNPFVELLITTFLTALAAAAMGLFVSSLFKVPDRATAVVPFLLMPQILFSGLIFKLEDAIEIISWFAICRWSMEGYGTTSNLNDLPLRLQVEGLPIEHEAESFFEYTTEHLLTVWGVLLLFTIAFLIITRIVLSRIGKEKA